MFDLGKLWSFVFVIRGMQITEALKLQLEVQKRLQEQLEASFPFQLHTSCCCFNVRTPTFVIVYCHTLRYLMCDFDQLKV